MKKTTDSQLVKCRLGTAFSLSILLAGACTVSEEHSLGQRTQAATFPNDAAWFPVSQAGVGMGDVETDGNNNGREVIGDANNPAVFIYTDGVDFFVRLRVDDDPSGSGQASIAPFGWGVVFDTNGDFSDYEFLLIADGTGTDTIRFSQNTVPGGLGDPNDTAEAELFTEVVDTGLDGNTAISLAGTNFGATPDFFLDFAIPLSALTDAGLTVDQTLNIVAGTSNNGASLSLDVAGCDSNNATCDLATSASDPTSLSGCGNSNLDEGEGCDDGNQVGADGCTECLIDQAQACNQDPAGATGGASCTTGVCDISAGLPGVCTAPATCGNNVLEAGEGCDDGNQIDDGNGCSANCLLVNGQTCNSNVNGAIGDESCESGLCDVSGAGDGVCEAPNTCGNNVLEAGEGCDDGNQADDGNGCEADCTLSTGQACNIDTSGATGDASCSSGVCDSSAGGAGVCEDANTCGNSALEAGEGCDDGDEINDGNGCEADCTISIGFACNDDVAGATGDASCESGVCDFAGGAPGVCSANLNCGNNILEAGEGCDDGNQVDDGNGCAPDCSISPGFDCNEDGNGATGDASCASGICDLSDGAPGTCTGFGDLDGDGIVDELDADIDNDSISNEEENELGIDPLGDADGDGVANYLDADDRGDGTASTCTATAGICDAPDENFDFDQDGVPNHEDLDSDNDGITDLLESGSGAADVDGDGLADGPHGSNGLADSVEDNPDSGGLNYTPIDTDGDGGRDVLDLDSDGDGDFDISEVSGISGLDADNDGVVDDIGDADGDGLVDAVDAEDGLFGFPAAGADPRSDDSDGDDIPDAYDPNDDDANSPGDADDDGLTDGEECPGGWPCPDGDNDGRPDYVDPDIDSDGDGVSDNIDLDDDNDGIPDAIEGDGDPDGDGIPNRLDLDSDGDGISDAYESFFGATDFNRDGVLDCNGGVGANGLCDEVETSPDSGITDPPANTDGDGSPDFLDLDSDGDLISDEDEAMPDPSRPIDTDGDGFDDFRDTDSDNDTIRDIDEAGDTDLNTPPTDSDGDGTPDYRDTDSDNDGFDDEDEGTDDPDGDGNPNFRDPDSDDDGIRDGFYASGGGCSTTSTSASWLWCLLVLAFLARRSSTKHARWGILTLVVLVSTFSGKAFAQDAPQNFALERFRLSLDGTGILDVESGEIQSHKVWQVSAWLGFEDDPLVVKRLSDDERIGALVDHRVASELIFSLGLFERLQLGIVLPLILSQDADDAGPVNQASISAFGVGDLRLAPKIALVKGGLNALSLSIIPSITLPTGAGDDYLGDDGVSFQPELAASYRRERFRVAANLLYQTRPEVSFSGEGIDDEWRFRVGAAHFVDDDIELDLTYSLSTSGKEPFADEHNSSQELLAGAAYYLRPDWILFGAGGPGLSNGFGTPDFRLLAGVRYSSQPKANASSSVDSDSDSDGDGIYDSSDACPSERETFNDFDDEDGCPDQAPVGDSDGDGLLDTEDQCPREAEDKDSFEDDNGCPDPDNDADGILDVEDECPMEPGEANNKGCPWPDRDNDTVADRIDNCPDEAGKPEFQGCNKRSFVRITDSNLEILDKVYFRTNKATILKKSYELLDSVAEVVGNHPEIQLIRVEGHTDSRGSDRKNRRLSERRAKAVMAYLVKKGVDKARLEAVGFGEEKPVDSNDTDEGRTANRRVEFKIVGDAEGEIKDQGSGPDETTMDKSDG